MGTKSIDAWKVALNRALRVAIGLLLVITSLAAHAVNESDLLSPEQAFPLTVTLSTPNELALDFNTQPGYYLYRERFSFEVDGAPLKPHEMPPGELKNDPTFGMVTVYHRPIRIRLPLPRPIASSISLSITSQGCADQGVCYPPQTRSYRVTADGSIKSLGTGNTAAAGGVDLPGVGRLSFVYSLLPVWLLMILIALLLTVCGVMLRAIDPLPRNAPGLALIGKALGILLVIGGVAEVVGVASGHFDILEPLGGVMRHSPTRGQSVRFDAVRSNAELDRALAAARGRPVMVDFYADWCISCKELERFTFADSRVISEFAHWKLLRIDVTKNTSEDLAMLRRFSLFGPPALIFYDRNGKQQRAAQLVGFVGADAFLAHLKKWGQ